MAMMEVQIKKAIKAGNSSAVILPRSWLNKVIRVELIKKTEEIILSETLEILKKYIELSDVIGIYLVGSYARREEDNESDIDILVVTRDYDKEIIYEGIYNILLISKELVKQKLEKDLFPIGQMIRESRPLLNADYLNYMKVNITKDNIKWYIDTTKDKLRLIEKMSDKVKDKESKVNNKIAYTLILRIRTLEIIKKLMKEEDYSKKEFVELIKKVSGTPKAYEAYLSVKNNQKENSLINVEQTQKLYTYLKKQLEEVVK